MKNLSELSEFEEMYDEANQVDIAAIKEAVKPLVDEMFDLDQQLDKLKFEFEKRSKELNALKRDVDYKIRNLWGPAIRGTDKAEIDLGDLMLSAKKILSVKTSDKEEAVQWFLDNGRKDVLKYDIHHATMGSIARKEFEKGIEIPGLVYSEFQAISVKQNKKK